MAEKVKTAKAPATPRKTAAKKKEPQLVPPQETKSQPVQHDDIRQLAHRYWSERGHPHGDADADWFRAEQELRGKAS